MKIKLKIILGVVGLSIGMHSYAATIIKSSVVADEHTYQPSQININSQINITIADPTNAISLFIFEDFNYNIYDGDVVIEEMDENKNLLFHLSEHAILPAGSISSGHINFLIQDIASYSLNNTTVIAFVEGMVNVSNGVSDYSPVNKSSSYNAPGYINGVILESQITADTTYEVINYEK